MSLRREKLRIPSSNSKKKSNRGRGESLTVQLTRNITLRIGLELENIIRLHGVEYAFATVITNFAMRSKDLFQDLNIIILFL